MFILFYFSILFFAFRDLERAEILSRHSNREELKLLPRRNQGLECAYIAIALILHKDAISKFPQQLLFISKKKLGTPKQSAHRGREIPWDSDSVEMLIK